MRAKKWAVGLALAAVAFAVVATTAVVLSGQAGNPDAGKYASAVLVVNVVASVGAGLLGARWTSKGSPLAWLPLVAAAIFGGLLTGPLFIAAAVLSWVSAARLRAASENSRRTAR